MTGPDAAPRIFYGAFSPLALHPDEDVRKQARGLALNGRDERRILTLAKDTYSGLKRWINDTNNKGEAAQYVDMGMLRFVDTERAGFVPADQLYLEVDRHEQVFNPDPLAAAAGRKLDPGIVFHGVTDRRDVVANFDVQPFLEAYVRRLSASVPEYVWRFGNRFYNRTNGFLLQKDPVRFEGRRFPVPKHVVQAFGPIPPVEAMECIVCQKSDERVGLQADPKMSPAHGRCIEAAAGVSGPTPTS